MAAKVVVVRVRVRVRVQVIIYLGGKTCRRREFFPGVRVSPVSLVCVAKVQVAN